MKFKSIQWNIGGGKIRGKESDATDYDTYSYDGLEYIAALIKEQDPDIVTMQEVHVGDINQAKELSRMTGLKYFIVDSYDESHIDESEKLSQAIISKYPISDHVFEKFFNPELKIVHNGITYPRTHDKGISKVNVDLNGKNITVAVLHLIPFKKCGIDPLGSEAKEVRDDINEKVKTNKNNFLLQGDFNINLKSLKEFLPALLEKDCKEIINNRTTTPRGRNYDHVIYKGFNLVKSNVIDTALTDHYPVVTEFEKL